MRKSFPFSVFTAYRSFNYKVNVLRQSVSIIHIDMQKRMTYNHKKLLTPPDGSKDVTAERLASHRPDDAQNLEKKWYAWIGRKEGEQQECESDATLD